MRRNLRVGQRLTGTVERSPWNWGVVGLLVRLDLPFRGFVDLLSLPYDADTWPQPGTVTEFEVVSLDDRPQVRLRRGRQVPPLESQPVGPFSAVDQRRPRVFRWRDRR